MNKRRIFLYGFGAFFGIFFAVIFVYRSFGGGVTVIVEPSDPAATITRSVNLNVSFADNTNTAQVEQEKDSFYQAALWPLAVFDITPEGSVQIDLLKKTEALSKITLFHRISTVSPEGSEFYREFYDDRVYSYFTYPFNSSLAEPLLSAEKIELQSLPATVLNDIYNDPKIHFFLLEGVSKDGTIGYSDILELSPQLFTNRATGAKLIVQLLNLQLDTQGALYFTDVPQESWYFPYVQTLLNPGFLDENSIYRPNDFLTRGELVRVLTEIFDVPFNVSDGGKHFVDVPETHPAYYAIESFYAAKRLAGFSNYFYPDAPVTRDFLNYLVKQHASP